MIPGHPHAEDPLVRFWRYVRKGEGCWEWTGGKFDGGYGAMTTAMLAVGVYLTLLTMLAVAAGRQR